MAVFYGIGVGPGDPELITLKAVDTLKKIDILLVPVSGNEKKSIAYEIAKQYISQKTQIERLLFPMSLDTGLYEEAGRKAALKVKSYIEQKKSCAFITIGDPCIYSTFGYIAKALPEYIQTVIIPGIPSFCAAAAAAKMMLAEKDEILSVIPLTSEQSRVVKATKSADRIVYMKAYKNISKVESLIDGNEICVVSNCGLPNQSIRYSNSIKKEDDSYLTLILTARK